MSSYSTFTRFCRRSLFSISTGVVIAIHALHPLTATAQLIDTVEGIDPGSSAIRLPLFGSDPIFGSGADDFDVDGGSAWVRHVGGGGPGWRPFTSIGGSLPLFSDNGALIIEAQGLVTNDGNGGGTIGLNRRFFAGDNLIGAGLWYDVNQSPNEHVYHQTAFSLELLRDDWSFRTNGFLPVGPTVRNVATSSGMGRGGNVEFQNNNLVATGLDSFRLDETAMRGIEVEIARSVGTWSGEVFAGYYNYNGKIGQSTDGIKGGVRGYVTPRLAGHVTISDDPLFGTNVYGGFTWFLGGTGGNAPTTIADKLTIPVERNQQVVVNNVSSGFNNNTPIILTRSGQPITITHIDRQAGGSDQGTFENPFLTLPGTQNSNIVYVHADGNYFDQSYDLNPNQRFLGEGEGNNHFVNTDQLGQIILPPGNSGNFRPVIQAINGQFALNSNANTEISNIDINNTGPGTRAGIFSDTGNVNVNRTRITGGFSGIDIIGGTGQFTFSDVTITDTTNAGLSVNGGTAGITFDGNSLINQGIGGSAVRVAGGHTGSLQFDGTVDASSGDGLQFDDADGQYDFRGQVQLNGGDAGIDILGGSAGTFTFTDTTITNPTGSGLNVDGGSSTIIFDGLSSINKNNGGSTVRVQGGHNGTITFNPNTSLSATGASAGDGLQFDDADGQYDFRGQVQLNGGDAGIDILGGSAGTFTFSDTTITDPTGTGLNVDGGGSTIIFDGLSSITKNNGGSTVRVQGGHNGTITFNPDTDIAATGAGAGDGLQFDDADGRYDFRGEVELNGGDAGIDILGGSAGTFTFSDTTITNPSGTGLNVDGGSSTIIFDGLSSIDKNNPGSTVRVQGGHDGTITFNPDTSVSATGAGAGDGLQFDNADGQYDFRGQVQLNGGDAGIDILGGSAGTFTFTDTSIDNPTGTAFNVENFEAGGVVNYDGSISVDGSGILNELITIDTTAAGSFVNFNTTGGNSLTSNGGGGIVLFDVDGNVTVTTPTNITNSSNGTLLTGISIFGGNGTHSFTDTTIDLNNNAGYNAGVEVIGQSGTLTFTNLNITTNDTFIGAVGIQLANSNNVNVLGTNNNINSNGAAAIELSGLNNINATFNNVTTTNTLNQAGKRNGIFLSDIGSGLLNVTGTTTFNNLNGQGIFANETAGTFTFANIDANNVAEDGLNLGVVTSNTGIFNINSGTFNNVGGDGVRMGSMGSGTGGGTLNLFNTTFTNIAGFTTNLSNSSVSGNGNIAVPFSSNDGGGNTGTILFNGGADSAP